MIFYNYFTNLSLFYVVHVLRQVSALSTEAIVNGIIANQSYFPYQVAIFGKPNLEAVSHLLCSGVIVAAWWILSIAHCFLMNSEQLKPLMFTAIVGFDDITRSSGLIVEIAYVYTDRYNHLYYTNDVAMAKTVNVLALSRTVNRINIGVSRNKYLNKQGRVSGYGRSKFERETDQNGNHILVLRDSDYKLRYTNVTYSRSRNCINELPAFFTYDKFCGVAVNIEGQYTGMCSDDTGSPLVIENKVVGLSCINHNDCNDINQGSIYVEVADHSYFINNVLMGIIKRYYQINIVYLRQTTRYIFK